jgi:DNA-binding NarL/FixJ family response regulator
MTLDVPALVTDGFRAMAAGEWSAADEAFRSALEIDESPEALIGLGNAAYWLGDLDGMLVALERAFATARARGLAPIAAGAALGLVGYYQQFLGNGAAARGWLSRASAIIEAHVPEMEGELLGARSFVADDPIEAERLARAALTIGRDTGNADLEMLALTAVGGALVQQGRAIEGMTVLDEAMAAAVADDCGNPMSVAHAGCMTMLVCASYFDIARATQWLQAMERFIDHYGCPFLYAECRTHYGRVLFENGDWAAAERFVTDAIAMSKGVTPTSHALACGTLAELRLAQGRMEDAARLVEPLPGRDGVVVATALVHVARGELPLAAAILRRRLEAVGVDRLDLAATAALLGEVELAQGEQAAARTRARALLDSAVAQNCALVAAYAHRLLGLALATIDPDEARRQLEAALHAFVQAEVPYRAAQVRLALARLLRDADPSVAVAEGRTALAIFEDLGAGADADQAAALLRDCGVHAARSGPRNLGRLTKREQEILGLLGTGASNPEIADRLFLSRRTVEHHVARVLAKLELRGRADAAAYAARNGIGAAAK